MSAAIAFNLSASLEENEVRKTPRDPETLEETGLSPSIIEHLLLRLLYFRGEMVGREMAEAVGLRFSIVDPFLALFKQQHLVEVKRSLGIGSISASFCLSAAGRNMAREYLENTQYIGPAPVPLSQYTHFVREQRLKSGWLTKEALRKAYGGMVMTESLLSQIGPAVSSGNSFLVYGAAGNGKTYMAEALADLDTQPVYVPHAIEHNGAIIQIFDPVYHQVIGTPQQSVMIQEGPTYDRRWYQCKRPFIITGGELSLEMLDLSYNHTSKVYEAPFQLKANNGIYLIDDFGRQRATPAEVLNRWIVPMERRIDYLNLRTGGKLTVPFDAFLVFSTNLRPEQLGDEAFLRRIQYKMLLKNPAASEFIEIFRKFCAAKKLPYPQDLPERFVHTYYQRTGKPMRRCHPRDVLSHALDLIHFEKLPYALTDDVIARAFESCFVQDTEELPPTAIRSVVQPIDAALSRPQ